MYQIPYHPQQSVYTAQPHPTAGYSPFPLEVPSSAPSSAPSLYISSGYSSSSTNPLSAPVTPNITPHTAWSLEKQQQAPPLEPLYQSHDFLGSPVESVKRSSMLQLISFSPKDGEEGTQVEIVVNAMFPFQPTPDHQIGPPPPKTLRILFAQLPVPTKVTNIVPVTDIEGNETFDGLTLYADAPDPISTGLMPPGVNRQFEPLSVTVCAQVLGHDNRILETKTMGRFTYSQGGHVLPEQAIPFSSPYASSPYASSGPRLLRTPVEHLTPGRSSPGLGPPSATLMRRGRSENGHMAGQSPENFGNAYRPEYPSRYSSTPTFQMGGNPAYPSGFASPSAVNTPRDWQPQTPNGPGRNPYGGPPPQPSPLQQSPHEVPVSGSASPAPGGPPGSQPSLMRTSQLSSGPVPVSAYVVSNAKASLVLQQDLNLMAVGWNQEEWHAKRRLVQFWRRQEGSVIHAAFRAISQAEYIPNSIVISCIYREDKNECFVTSVDGIYLLEALVGVRFSVEEKNRIRRNLEGFRPITVSKNKQGAEDFFKLVMSFPNPKPRNIEKDVKVFPWKIFGTALKKIIGKYSANYALPPNGDMAPPQVPILTRHPSPPVEPYTIPAPLMPAPSPHEALPVNFPAYPVSRSVPPPDKPIYHVQVEPVDPYFGSGHQHQYNQGMPPTPQSYHGLSSNSSGSLPTLASMGNHHVEIRPASDEMSAGLPRSYSGLMDQSQLTYPSSIPPFSKHTEGFPMAPQEPQLPLRTVSGSKQETYQ